MLVAISGETTYESTKVSTKVASIEPRPSLLQVNDNCVCELWSFVPEVNSVCTPKSRLAISSSEVSSVCVPNSMHSGGSSSDKHSSSSLIVVCWSEERSKDGGGDTALDASSNV